MFQIELLSGGVFWVYAVYPQNSAFLIWKDDHWVLMAADKCKPYVQPWAVTTGDNFPSTDAVPVVRCKDCRYLGRELDKGLYSCDDYNLPYCEPDSYCSHGRRKEETKHAAD